MAAISKLYALNITTCSQFNGQDFYTKNKQVTSYRIALTAASTNVKPITDITAVIYDSFEVIKEDWDPSDKIIAKVEELKTFDDEIKANRIVSFLKVYC